MMKVLVIAAHPDDEILGCGGTIYKLRKQDIDSYVLILTDGADKRYSKEMKAALKNNAIKANKIAGTKEVFFGNLANQQLDTIPIIKIIQLIEKYIHKIKPDTLFIHHRGDLNKDHQLSCEAAMVAARPIISQVVKKVYTYSVSSSTEWNFTEGEDLFIPNTFVDIKEAINIKIEAMKCYVSECRPYPHPRSPEVIKAYSHYWGLIVGMEYAEPFKLVRSIKADL